jgi:hypothetical protein
MFRTRLTAISARGLAAALATAVLAIGAVQYTPSAEARGFSGGHAAGGHWSGGGAHWGGGRGWGGALLGGAIIGGALASSYYYGGYYSPYYYPPAYYPPAVYPAAPSAYIEQQPYGSDGPQASYGPPPSYGNTAPPSYAGAPPGVQQQQQQLSVEQRAQRLQSMCDQHLFTPQECASRRAELMQEM